MSGSRCTLSIAVFGADFIFFGGSASYTLTVTGPNAPKLLTPDVPVQDIAPRSYNRRYVLKAPASVTFISIDLSALSGYPGAAPSPAFRPTPPSHPARATPSCSDGRVNRKHKPELRRPGVVLRDGGLRAAAGPRLRRVRPVLVLAAVRVRSLAGRPGCWRLSTAHVLLPSPRYYIGVYGDRSSAATYSLLGHVSNNATTALSDGTPLVRDGTAPSSYCKLTVPSHCRLTSSGRRSSSDTRTRRLSSLGGTARRRSTSC